MRILLAEDEHSLGTWLSRALEHAGIQVEWVSDGLMADRALQHADYDALVLDLGLPGLDGHGVLQRLRERDQRLPALILTARDSLDERVRLLNAGADDFLAKPFELAELEARLHALVRRARGNEHPRLACGSLVYDGQRKQFTLQGAPLALSPRELAVLRVLVQRSGEPFSKQQIRIGCSLTTKTFTPKQWKCLCTGCASVWKAATYASPPCAGWATHWSAVDGAVAQHMAARSLWPAPVAAPGHRAAAPAGAGNGAGTLDDSARCAGGSQRSV